MDRLTLDEAIKYIKEVVCKNRKNKEKNTIVIPNSFISSADCAEKYEQVAKWLKELKSYKEAEEQGLLVRLPVKIETELFQPCADRKSIIRSIVINNTITDDDIYIGIIDERGNERHYSKKIHRQDRIPHT